MNSNKLFLFLLLFTFLVFIGLGSFYYFYVLRKSGNTGVSQLIKTANTSQSVQDISSSWSGIIDFIMSNCKEIPPFESESASVSYISKLFSSLGNSVIFDKNQNAFVSQTSQDFSILPINPNREKVVQNFDSPHCEVVLIGDRNSNTDIAFETTSGDIKIFHLNNFANTLLYSLPVFALGQ